MLSIVEGIAAASGRNPAAPALVTGNRSIAYGELLDALARISNHLASRDLPQRAKLFLNIGDPDLRLIVTIAALHAGFIPFVVLDIGALADQVDYDFVVGSAVPHLPDLACDLMIDQAALGDKLSDGMLRGFPEQPDDAILLIGATSGSTGRPKLVAQTYGCFRTRDRWRRSGHVGATDPYPWLRVSSGDRLVSTLGDVTFTGFVMAVQTLSQGAAFVRMSRDRHEMLKFINLYAVDSLRSAPGTLGELMDAMDATQASCPSVRKILVIGGLLAPQLLQRIEAHFAAEVAVGYGSTETGWISGGVVDPVTFEPGYVGELFPEMKIVTSGSRSDPAPLTMIRGEGSALLSPYVNGKAVRADGPFYTLPDLGFIEDGRVYLTGRDDEVLNISGNKIAYGVIEGALRAMPGVRDVAVANAASVGDAMGLVIGVVADLDADFAAFGRRVNAIVKTPEAVEHIRLFRIDAIPRNAFGKTDRGRLTAAWRRRAEGGAGSV